MTTAPAPLTRAEFQEQTGLGDGVMARLDAHLALLDKWQKRINLVGTATLADPWRRHYLDSAQLAELVPTGARTLVDLGSGAGFPGLVLAAILAESRGVAVHLVEADGRKAAFLAEADREMGTRAHIHKRRVESLIALGKPDFDVITARALAPLPRLLGLVRPLIGPKTTCIFPKGKKAREELTECSKNWTMTVKEIPSLADPFATVLILEGISRRE